MNFPFLDRTKQIHISAEIEIVNKSWLHPVTDETHQSRTVSLIPKMSTAMMILFGDYLPFDVYKEPFADRNPAGFKMWALVMYPVPHFAQVMLCRGNHFVNVNHLHVITSITEEYLQNKKGSWLGFGKPAVDITLYPELTDTEREAIEDYVGVISN